MKLAWLCYTFGYIEDDGTRVSDTVEILFEHPDRWHNYQKIVPIVYAEIEN